MWKVGSSSSLYSQFVRYGVVAQTILAKSVSESLKLCEICKQYQLLDRDDMNRIKGVSVCDLCIIYSIFVQ